MGHRGRKDDPLYRARKLLVSGYGRITDNGWTKLTGLLDAGDPHGEVRNAWHAKETLRGIYKITDPETGAATVEQLADEFCDPWLPEETHPTRPDPPPLEHPDLELASRSGHQRSHRSSDYL